MEQEPKPLKDGQIRVDGETAHQLGVEAATQRTTVKALIERLWESRKRLEFPFFPDVFGIQFSNASDETILYTRLAASVLADVGHKDRLWLIGALNMIIRERRQ